MRTGTYREKGINFMLAVLICSCNHGGKPHRPSRSTERSSDSPAEVKTDVKVGESSKSDMDSEMSPDPNQNNETSEPGQTLRGEVTISFQITQPNNTGNYAPNHLQAIWITDSNNQLIKTIEASPGRRPQHLRQWQVATQNQLDGFTGATIRTYENVPASLVWDLKDKNGILVSKGLYKVWFELTESNTFDGIQDGSAGYSVHQVPFMLNLQDAQVVDQLHTVFTNITVTHKF